MKNLLTSDPMYTDEQVAFMKVMERYKREKQRRHPSAVEILAVAISMGYRLVAEPGPLSDGLQPQRPSHPNFRKRAPMRRVVLPIDPIRGPLS